MAANSAIEWTDATWNPWQGCTKVSPACANCYMFSDMKRYGKDGSVVHKSSDDTWGLPIKRWKRGDRAGQYKIPPGLKVFTCSWSDWFHKTADPWRDQAWDIIRQRPDLTFQIVTKRTERIADCLPPDWGDGWPNVWLIATVENQQLAEVRIPQLLRIPAVVRGLSCEPLLGPIALRFRYPIDNYGGFHNFDSLCGYGGWDAPRDNCKLHWVIAGGESGHNARPVHPDWIRSLRDQCQAAGVAFHFKQWGEWCHWSQTTDDAARQLGSQPDGPIRLGKAKSGRLLDGRTWDEFPKVEATT